MGGDIAESIRMLIGFAILAMFPLWVWFVVSLVPYEFVVDGNECLLFVQNGFGRLKRKGRIVKGYGAQRAAEGRLRSFWIFVSDRKRPFNVVLGLGGDARTYQAFAAAIMRCLEKCS